jgi:hypothetical protein
MLALVLEQYSDMCLRRPNPSFHRTLRDEAAQRPVNSNVRRQNGSQPLVRNLCVIPTLLRYQEFRKRLDLPQPVDLGPKPCQLFAVKHSVIS